MKKRILFMLCIAGLIMLSACVRGADDRERIEEKPEEKIKEAGKENKLNRENNAEDKLIQEDNTEDNIGTLEVCRDYSTGKLYYSDENTYFYNEYSRMVQRRGFCREEDSVFYDSDGNQITYARWRNLKTAFAQRLYRAGLSHEYSSLCRM